MRALKLVQHMKANADRISEELLQRIRSNNRCSELLRRVPADEQKQYALDIYRDLTDWLAVEIDSLVASRYLDLGIQRAHLRCPVQRRILGGVHSPRLSLGVRAAGVPAGRAS
jgi:hypothetical protein